MSSFADFPLLPSLHTSLAELGLTKPTEIQRKTVPALLAGGPMVAVAETGSGKTLAYVLPMLHRLKSLEAESRVESPGRPRGLVMVPGRELGEQIAKVFKSLTHGTRVRVRTATGGTQKQIARQSVSSPFEILVATPGRLQRLLAEGGLYLDDVRMLVFDEADQMLDHGFLPIAKDIVKGCPRNVQLVMFGATLPPALSTAIKDLFVAPPLRVNTRGSQRLVATLTTDNRAVVHGRRMDVLRTVFAKGARVGTMMFANTREQCEKVSLWLTEEGIEHVTYLGQMDRLERRRNLARFRDGGVATLLTTDLGGRGLDSARVERVINVHLPADVDNYLHRVGRTARAGRAGLVINLVTERDRPLLARLKDRESPRG